MLRIGYARVSTQDQSVDMQLAAMDRYGIHRECIFADTLSGAHAQRPGLIEALRARHSSQAASSSSGSSTGSAAQ